MTTRSRHARLEPLWLRHGSRAHRVGDVRRPSGARDFRLPELFCGFGRDESRAIVAYPVACLAVERPRLPEWLSGVEIRDIDVGDSCISLSFRRTDSNATGFSLLDHRGDVQVTMSA